MNKSLFIDIILICLYINTYSQSSKVSGYITDSSGTGIPYITIIAKDTTQNQILAFSQTNDSGYFTLSWEKTCQVVVFTARGVGYTKSEIARNCDSLIGELRFVLGNYQLEELLVKSQALPVIVKNDTTEYHVAAFSDSTEVTVEDLLKKIPGIQVDENGGITLNGQRVDRVLVEGDDLFNNNYTYLTRNMRANILSKVQAIDDYQENPLLKGIENSERLVLNLKIKEDKKNNLSGNIDGGSGAGYELKYYGQCNLISISKKSKAYVLSNINNLGMAMMGEVNQISDTGLGNSLQNSPLQIRNFNEQAGAGINGIPDHFFTDRSNHMLYAGYLLPFSGNNKIKMGLWKAGQSTHQNYQYGSRYFTGTDTLSVLEVFDLSSTRQKWHFQAESDYFSPKNIFSFRSFANCDLVPSRYAYEAVRTESFQNFLPVIENNQTKDINIYAGFELSWKKSDDQVFQIISKNAYGKQSSLLLPTYQLYPVFFGLDSSFIHLQQEAIQDKWMFSVTGRYIWVTKNGTRFKGEIGWRDTKAGIMSALALRNTDSALWQSLQNPDFSNDLMCRSIFNLMSLSVSKNYGNLFLSLFLQASYRRISVLLPDNTPAVGMYFPLRPSLTMNYKISPQINWDIKYSYQPDFPEPEQLSPGYIMRDYATFTKGIVSPMPAFDHHLNSRIQSKGRTNINGWSLIAHYYISKNEIGSSYHVTGLFSISDAFRPMNTRSYGADWTMFNYFKKIRIRFDYSLGLNTFITPIAINEESLKNTRLNLYSASLKTGTAFDGWLNAGLNWSTFLSNRKTISPTSKGTYGNTSHIASFMLIFKPVSRLKITLKTGFINNQLQQGQSTSFWTSEGRITYSFKKQNNEIQINMINIFNTKFFEQFISETYFQSFTAYQATGRFFWATYGINF